MLFFCFFVVLCGFDRYKNQIHTKRRGADFSHHFLQFGIITQQLLQSRLIHGYHNTSVAHSP